MKNKIIGWLLMKKAESATRKHAHRCLDCDEVSSPVRRMSVLNILVYLVIGVVIGGFTLWKIGFVVGFGLILLNAFRIKPACGVCFKTNIRLMQWEELQVWQEERKAKAIAMKPVESDTLCIEDVKE